MNALLQNLVAHSDRVRRVLGITPAVGRQIDRAQLYLGAGWMLRTAALVLALGALWFGLAYLRDGRRPSLWVKAPLLLLRLVSLAALLTMVLQPVLRLGHSQRQRASVIVLADTSMSMARQDTHLPPDRAAQARRAAGADPATLTRAQIVERAANNPTVNLLASLSHRFNVHVYDFDSTAREQSLAPRARATGRDGQAAAIPLRTRPDPVHGTSTQIGTAISSALADVSGQRIAGVLLLTDGGNNLGPDPVTAAAIARRQGTVVSTVGVGDPTPTRDLAITEVLADQKVRKDNAVQVFAGIAHRGYAGRTVNVTLRRGSTVIGTQRLTLGPDAGKQTVTFGYTPKELGTFSYTVAVDELPGEVTVENNRKRFTQAVVGKKLKVLFIDGEPRWEYRYLKNAILRDTQIEFSSFVTASGPQNGGDGNVKIYRFPEDEKSLFAYDIVILGDVPRSYFTDLELRSIRRFVEDKGSSLVVICGEKHMPSEYRDTPLAAVFPVALPSYPDQVRTDEPFPWELTPEGRQEPMLRMSEDPAESARIWHNLPGMLWSAGVERAKPGATVLAVNASRSNQYGKRIILAVQTFGAGRCLFSTVDTTWRWRWRVGDRYFYRYWGQALRALTPAEPAGGNRFAQVNVDRGQYLLGDRVSIHARLLDSFYRPVKDPQVIATISGDTGAPFRVTLTSVPGSPGLYSSDLLADRVGKFELAVASPAAPDRPAKAAYVVQSIALEQQQPEMNEALLRRIAASGGGRYYHPDEIRAWLDSLRPNDLVVRSESEVELWDAPFLLWAFVIPLTIEWVVRKRTGMV